MNNLMKDYLKDLNNENKNFESIKIKMDKQKKRKKLCINIAAIFFVMILIGTTSPKIYAKFQQSMRYKEYTRRNYVSGKGIIASLYTEKIDMEYVYQNNIGVKIDSIILTDDSFKANINLKLPENLRIDKKEENVQYSFGYAVYDENNNILGVSDRIDEITIKNGIAYYNMCLYKELGIKYNKNDIFLVELAKNKSCTLLEKNDDTMIYQLELNSLKGFPNSEKIYIRIFNIGYSISEDKNLRFSEHNNYEWSFEINTPDKFLKRQNINLVLLDEIPKLKIEKFVVTETGMVFIAKKKDVVETMGQGKEMENWGEINDALLNITDEQGNIYYPVQGGTTGDKNEFYNRFEIDKDIFENTTLYLNMKLGNEEYISEISKE